MPKFTSYKLLEACREPGCPVCRLAQRSVERYLDSHFYENVNSPKWRDQLRASLGFCHEHAWLAVEKRLGDALGFSIIYQDIMNSILRQLEHDGSPRRAQRNWTELVGQLPEATRRLIQKILPAITARKRCPACEHRDQVTRTILASLVKELHHAEVVDALEASEGICLSHLRLALEDVRDGPAAERLIAIQSAKLARLRTELAEFIRKNDYQVSKEGFGSEGDAWLRVIGMVVGNRK
ncbi:MAG TPA: DUF6062 family protein [Anaerolineales bacterium]